jgi:hypothetical protein
MKNAIFITIIIALFFTLACSNAQSISPEKVLIVYLSRTNNTKAIAEIIHNHVEGTLVALELEKPYPENGPQRHGKRHPMDAKGFRTYSYVAAFRKLLPH